MKRFYTAESVTEGHPDKFCDLITDSVLDDCLTGDSDSRVACEVLATKGRIIVAGEITSRQNPDVSEIVKEVLEDVGYSTEEIQIDVFLHRQSPDIAEAVAHSLEQREGLSEEQDERNEGAGDQGVMVGFACRETPSLIAEYRELLQHQTFLFINIMGDGIGQPLKVDSVYKMLERMEKKTQIKITPHMLRRYFANMRREAGWRLEMISQALGHKHLETTIQYLNMVDDNLIEASNEFYEKHSAIYGIQGMQMATEMV